MQVIIAAIPFDNKKFNFNFGVAFNKQKFTNLTNLIFCFTIFICSMITRKL